MNHKITYLIVLIFITLQSKAQSLDTLILFEKQQVVYLLADSVNIRKTPDVDGATVAKLPIGTKLTILDKSKYASRINNILMPWYLVEFNGKQKGYVWGGKIALNSFRSNKNPDIVFHFGIEKSEEYDATFQIRVEQSNKELQRISFKGFGSAYKRHTCTNISNKGLSNVDDILQVDGYGESCGDDAGTIVFFWSNNKLTLIEQLRDIGDGGFFDKKFYVYPADMQGEKDFIIKKEQAGEILFDEGQNVASWSSSNVKYDKNIIMRFKWDGYKLVKVN